jgi:Uma2 family endonuclease
MEVPTIMTPAPVLTTQEYFKTPESTLPQELAYGVWRVADAPTPRHQSAVFAFGLALNRFVRSRGLGRIYLAPVDVVLDPVRHLVVQPDVLFVERTRLAIVQERIWGAPDLVLEVLSPRPRVGSLDERLEWFAQYGVRECWLLHQDERTLEVLQLSDGRDDRRRSFRDHEPVRSAVLPGWDATLSSVMAGFQE